MPDPPLLHLAWPYQLGATVEQDTDAAHRADAAMVISTPRGHRDDDPAFGVTQPIFEQRPLDLERLASEIVHSAPDLQLDADELLDLTAATVATVRVSVTGP